ncbi:MAG: ShlB/FhaC/HecB family hemolysin secretion/activation protein [Synechococcus sp.]
MLFLAQLVAPPLQPGPVRLPSTTIEQRTTPEQGPVFEQPKSGDRAPEGVDNTEAMGSTTPLSWTPDVVGDDFFTDEQLNAAFKTCRQGSVAETLNNCAAKLTAQLLSKGYINSRVYVLQKPEPGALEVVLGRISEVNITSTDPALQSKAEQELNGLIGDVLHLPTLEQALVRLRQRGFGQIKGGMQRLGSDPTQAAIQLTVEPAPASPLQGDITLGNNGNIGSGEWRSSATLLKKDLMKRGDLALVYFELDADGQLELGTGITSLTYRYPLNDTLSLTGSLGYSYRRFVEFKRPAFDFNFRTTQGLLQLEQELSNTAAWRWTAAAGISANRTSSFEGDDSIPLVLGGGPDGYLKSGNLKLSTNIGHQRERSTWNANLYFLQGLAGVTKGSHRHNLKLQGTDIGEARAIGGLLDVSWLITPNLVWTGRAAGQHAFAPLPSSMTFSLGSDVGLRGLPGSLVSGDSGWLGSTELVWTAWSDGQQAIQVVPFIGAGGIHTDVLGDVFEDSIGSGGLVGRYVNGPWQVELGWVDTFKTDDNPGLWNNWVLGHGLHTKLRYTF